MKRITITVSKDTAEALAKLAKECSDMDKSRDGATTHGPLTPAKLLAMLAEDAGVTPFGSPSNTVISGSTTGQGAFAVADPRAMHRGKGDHYLTGGHYGVVPWEESCGAVSGSACHDNGRFSVADPRMPRIDEKTIAVIRSLDGTWHRPFTTLELAALQGLVDPEEQLELDGLSDQSWRERIGNAVPAPAAQAIASEMGRTLLLAWGGGTLPLEFTPIWVRNVAVALAVSQGGAERCISLP